MSALLTTSCAVPRVDRLGLGIGDFATTWTVGSCHRMAQFMETDPVYNTDSSPAVPCDSPHSSETFAVASLTGAVAAAAQRPSPLLIRPAMVAACAGTGMIDYLGAQPVDALRDVSIMPVVPTEPEWRRGVRTVRCDILLGPRTRQGVAMISQTLRGVLTEDVGARFRVCSLGPVQVGCDRPHDAELVRPTIAVSGADLAHRTRAAIAASVYAACIGPVSAYLGTPLTDRPDLAVRARIPGEPPLTDSRDGTCWVGPARPGRAVTGSVRSRVPMIERNRVPMSAPNRVPGEAAR
ncbi:septum formation family protein [Catenulispora yoronensis]